MSDEKRIIAFTGTQRGMSGAQSRAVRSLLIALQPALVLHGGCIGADVEFSHIARDLDLKIESYPSDIAGKVGNYETDWDHLPPWKPLARNKVMATRCDILIATPGEHVEQQRSGTWSTIRYAREIGRKRYVVYPIGTVRED